MKEEFSFHMFLFLKKMTPNYLETERFWVIMRKKRLLKNFELNLRNTTSNFFIKQLKIVVNCFCNRFQQKDHIEILQKMGILFLKVLRDEDFDHELQQMSWLFGSDLHKFKLETQLKTLNHICWWKISWNKRCCNNYFIIKDISKAVRISSA